MPTLVVNDNSWGEGISGLMGGFVKDPEKRAQALALQARIDATSLAAKQTQIENENLLAKRKAQDEAVRQGAMQFGLDRIAHVPTTVDAPQETLRASYGSEFQGPFPSTPVPNPVRRHAEQDLQTGRAIYENAIRSGATPAQAYQAIELARVNAAGVPTYGPQAAKSQTLLTGQLPDTRVPLTEEQRRVIEREETSRAAGLESQRQAGAMSREQLQQATRVDVERMQEEGRRQRFQEGDLSIGENATVHLSPARRKALGLPPEGPIQGQVSVAAKETVTRPGGQTLRGAELPDPNAPPPSPLTEGSSQDLVYRRSRLHFETKHRAGTLTPEELRQWIEVDAALHEPKAETRKGDKGQNITVFTQTPRPAGAIDPRTLLPPPSNPQPGTGTGTGGTGTTASAPGRTTGTVAQTTTADAAAAGVPPATSAAKTTTRTVTDPNTGQQVTMVEEAPQAELATADRSNAMAQTGLIEVQANKIKQMIRGGPQKPYSPGIAEMALGDRSRTGTPGVSGTLWDMAKGGVQNLLDPQASTYQNHAQALINALTRLESGAAIGEPERRRYIDMLIPNVLDNTPEKVEAKLQLMDDIVAMRARGLSNDEIRKWVNAKADERDAAAARGAGTAPAPAATAAPAPPARKRMRLNPQTQELEEVP